MKVSEITVKNLAVYLKLDFDSLSIEEIAELDTFLHSARAFIVGYTGLNETEVDIHEDFVPAVYILVQDMYDNRSYYVDKNNLNRVVKMILDMHSVNLL